MLKIFMIGFLLFPFNCFANLIALGYEGNDTNSSKPLVIQKNNNDTWSKNPTISGLPTNITHLSFYQSSCTNHYCIAAMNYEKNAETLALILSSHDDGKSWVVMNHISGIPTYINEINFFTLHCEDNICMAGGRMVYGKDHNHQRPLLLMSTDNGETWTVSNAGAVNLMNKTEGQVEKVTQSGKNWMASGLYYSSHLPMYQLRFFMISHDNGVTWKELNFDGNKGIFSDLKCMDAVCLLFGTGNKGVPLIARSEDNGNSWKTLTTITGVPSYFENPVVDELSCYQNFCAAEMQDSSTMDLSNDIFLLMSHDQGKSWITSSKIQNTPPDFQYGELTQMECYNQTTCTAIGGWRKKNYDDFFPMIVTTVNGGATWTYQDNHFIKSNIHFNAIKCENNNCDIVGVKDNTFLMLTSYDGGFTWVENDEIVGLPRGSVGGLNSFLIRP